MLVTTLYLAIQRGREGKKSEWKRREKIHSSCVVWLSREKWNEMIYKVDPFLIKNLKILSHPLSFSRKGNSGFGKKENPSISFPSLPLPPTKQGKSLFFPSLSLPSSRTNSKSHIEASIKCRKSPSSAI